MLEPDPLAMVTVPLDGVRLVPISLILIRVPAPSLTSGLEVGKLVSLAIGTKPPTSSTRSMTRASIAAVVAIEVSLLDQVSPDSIVSPVS